MDLNLSVLKIRRRNVCYGSVKKPIRVKAELHITQSCKREILTELFLELVLEYNTYFSVLLPYRWT